MAKYRLPYSGSPELWTKVPNGELTVWGRTGDPLAPVEVGGPDHLVISILATDQEQWQLKNERTAIINHLTTKVGWVNQQVDEWNERIRTRVRQHLLQQVELSEQAEALDLASDIPIYRAPIEEQVPIPVERKSIRPAQTGTPGAARSVDTDPALAQGIYNDVVQTIEQMTRAMELMPTTALKLDEEEIRNLILFVLNANYRGAVAGEVFNGEGKTDILLRWDGANAFIGECKFWKGPQAFRDAIEQMLGYVTWRDTKAAMIVFMRGGKPTEIMESAKKELREHEAFESELPDGTSTRGDFVLHAKGDPEQKISIALIGVVIRRTKGTAT
jgi:hypothetical protein